MRLYDAHNHLAEASLKADWSNIRKDLLQIGLNKAVVNGTSEADWDSVIELALSSEQIIPLIGLHPWQVEHASTQWKKKLAAKLSEGGCGIGETGLDRSIRGSAIEDQIDAFKFQLALATERDLPISIHSIKATGLLTEILRTTPLPRGGFHLHAYSGPIELIDEFAALGAYFSFNGAQIGRDSKRTHTAIRATPMDRLLIETDAPYQLPPQGLRPFTVQQPNKSGRVALNHPANLQATYEAIARIREVAVKTLAQSVEANFTRYFIHSTTR